MIFIQKQSKQFKYKGSTNDFHTEIIIMQTISIEKTTQITFIQRQCKQFQYKDTANDFHTKQYKDNTNDFYTKEIQTIPIQSQRK